MSNDNLFLTRSFKTHVNLRCNFLTLLVVVLMLKDVMMMGEGETRGDEGWKIGWRQGDFTDNFIIAWSVYPRGHEGWKIEWRQGDFTDNFIIAWSSTQENELCHTLYNPSQLCEAFIKMWDQMKNSTSFCSLFSSLLFSSHISPDMQSQEASAL